MPDIDPATAARIELALDAHDLGNRALAAGMLLSLPEAQIAPATARLRLFGADPATLLSPARPTRPGRAHPQEDQ